MTPADYPDLFRPRSSDRMVRRPGRPGARVRIYGLARSAACRMSIAWCWAVWSKASGRRRRAAIPGSTGRCATSSASICRNAASACRRTTSRKRSAPGSDPHSRRQARRRADGRVALRAAACGGRGRRALEGGAVSAATNICTGRARSIRRQMTPKSAPRPQPKPPAECAPKSLSVTEIEHWLRDPYSIYAQPCSEACGRSMPVDTPPGARDRGTVIHEAIGDFTAQFKNGLPADPLAELLRAWQRRLLPRWRIFPSPGVLVAAVPAHRALVRRFRDASAAADLVQARRRESGRTRNSARERRFSR